MTPDRRSLRVTVPATAATVVAVALVIGAGSLHAALQNSLERGVTDTAGLRARDVAALARSGPLPRALSFPGEERSIVQVLDTSGAVLAATGNIDGEPALVTELTGGSRTYVADGLPIGSGQRFAMAVVGADTAAGHRTVVSAESLDRVDATLSTVRRGFLMGVPLLVLLVAVLARVGVTRSLRPVERIRSDVAEISARDLHRRVADPGGDDEIARLAMTMNHMLDRLDEASQRQRRFVADASHELRSPLTSLRAGLEVGLSRPARPDWPRRARLALDDATRLEALVADLLVLARLDDDRAQQPAGGRGECDLTAIARDEARSGPRSPAVTVSSTGDGHVQGSAPQLARALRNLVDNARRHARSEVRVQVERSERQVTVDVEDDGAGIAPADRDRVFERFVRLDEARARDAGGSGLGLSITREIVLAHGGTVAVLDGRPGARLRITLPVQEARPAPRPPDPA
jgi:signal transduction histidine kinase